MSLPVPHRRTLRVLSGLALAAAAAGAVLPALAADPVRSLNLGDTVTGTVESGVKEVLPFDAIEGTFLDADVIMGPGAFPAIFILQPDRTFLPGLAAYVKADAKGKKVSVRKVPITASGRHYLVVVPSVPGTYKARVKGKLPKKTAYEGNILGEPAKQIDFGALPGSLVSVKAKRGKGSGLQPLVATIEKPSGAPVDLGAAKKHVINEKLDAYTDVPVDELGTYTAFISTQTGLFGDIGQVQIKIKAPKVAKANRPDGEVIVDPFVDSVLPTSGFDNLTYAGLGVTGDFFVPGVQVKLVGPSATVPASSVVRVSDTQLAFDIDLTGQPTGAYDLVVTVPSGGEGVKPGAFQVKATPVPTVLSPSTGFDNRSQAFTLSGSRFQTGLSVAAIPEGGGPPIPAVVGTVTSTSAGISLPLLDAPLGSFDLLVTNPDGGQATLADALTVGRGPRISSANPLLGHDNDDARAVTLSGSYFQAGLAVTLVRSEFADIPGAVSGVTASSATATFDLRGAAPGAWTLVLTNPDGGLITASSPFSITRAPRVQTVTPSRGFDEGTLAGIVARGTDFVAGAQAFLEIAESTTATGTGEAVGGGGTTVTFDADLTGLAAGPHDLRVTNPDGGSELLPGGFTVLGRRGLASSASAGGRPAAAHNPDRDEYLVVWSESDGTQWDLRAQRFSADTGLPLGTVLPLTDLSDDATGTESQVLPSVAYSPSLGIYTVVYGWTDPDGATGTTGVRAQFVAGDGSDFRAQGSAYPMFSASAGMVSPPRVVWNPDEGTYGQWMIVWAWDASSGGDLYHLVLNPLNSNGINTFYGEVSSGVLVATSHTSGEDTIPDFEYDPDVAYASTTGEYLVTWTWDFNEADAGGDTGTDVRAAFYDSDFSSGPNQTALLTTLGNESGADEARSAVAFDPVSGVFLVVWDYEEADIRAQRIQASSRAKTGSLVTRVEDATDDPDASRPCVSWTGTSGTDRWLVGAAVEAGTAGSSSVLLTVATADLATRTDRALAGPDTGAGYSDPSLAVRGSTGEFLAGWSVDGGAENSEIRFGE